MRLIWNLRNERLFETHTCLSEHEIHDRWVSAINTAMRKDQLLTNRVRFGGLALEKQLALNTWSGAPPDKDSCQMTVYIKG